MNKLIDFIKQNQLIILIALAGIACFVFYDHLIEIIIGAFGLGGAAIAAKKQQAKESIAQGEVFEEQADAHLVESVKEVKKAQEMHEIAVKLAKKEQPDAPVKPGFKKKKITSR